MGHRLALSIRGERLIAILSKKDDANKKKRNKRRANKRKNSNNNEEEDEDTSDEGGIIASLDGVVFMTPREAPRVAIEGRSLEMT